MTRISSINDERKLAQPVFHKDRKKYHYSWIKLEQSPRLSSFSYVLVISLPCNPEGAAACLSRACHFFSPPDSFCQRLPRLCPASYISPSPLDAVAPPRSLESPSFSLFSQSLDFLSSISSLYSHFISSITIEFRGISFFSQLSLFLVLLSFFLLSRPSVSVI